MSKRLLSLDIVRGMTVVGMIMVNNGYHGSFEALRHAEWNGLSLSDLVFPFFLFIMGVSMFLSFSGKGFKLTPQVLGKILKRTLLLLLIGIAINWFDKAIYGNFGFQELRFWAVLQRIALCYLLVSLFAFAFNRRYILTTATLLLVIYAAILIAGDGYSQEKTQNILYLADKWLLGDAHLYHKSAVDPEGLLSTIPSVANVLFGFYCGMKIKELHTILEKTNALFFAGSVLTFAGFIVNFAFPCNKHIWSPSFALVTSGFCTLLLALMMVLIDGRGKRGAWVDFFQIFGTNALLLYITSEVMAIAFGRIGLNDLLFDAWSSLIPVPQLASLAYAVTYVAMNFAIGYPLWRKHIYVKL